MKNKLLKTNKLQNKFLSCRRKGADFFGPLILKSTLSPFPKPSRNRFFENRCKILTRFLLYIYRGLIEFWVLIPVFAEQGGFFLFQLV